MAAGGLWRGLGVLGGAGVLTGLVAGGRVVAAPVCKVVVFFHSAAKYGTR